MNGIGWEFELEGGGSWQKVVSRVVSSQTLYSPITSYQLRSGNGRGGSGTVGTDIDIIA